MRRDSERATFGFVIRGSTKKARLGICDFFDNANWAVVIWPPAAPGTGSPDTNNDGAVNVLDLIELLLKFGQACP